MTGPVVPPADAPPELAAEIRRAAAAPDAALGPYLLLERLGQGSFGAVYRGWDPRHERVVAVKVLTRAEGGVDRFEREVRAIGRLRHPAIVGLYDSGEDRGTRYLVMELGRGRPLDRFVGRRAERLEPRDAARVVRDAARAIHHAHREGVLHRDLKPSNMLLDPDGGVRILDFGLARFFRQSSDLTRSDAIVGTIGYMAPETVGPEGAEARSDVFSLGAVLYTLLAGREPFEAPNALTYLAAALNRRPDPPGAHRPGVDPDLDTVCLTCLASEPDARYATARELAEDLDRILDGEPIRAEAPTPWRRARLWLGRNRRRVGSAAAGLAALGLVLLWATVLGPAWDEAAERARLDELERRAAAAAAAEAERLAAAPPDEVLRAARADVVRAKVTADLAPVGSAEVAAVARGVGGFPAGALRAAVHLERGEAAAAYAADPGGGLGAEGRRRVAERYLEVGRPGRAAAMLRSLWDERGERAALAPLAQAAAAAGDWPLARRALAELARDGEPLAPGLAALGEVLAAVGVERQALRHGRGQRAPWRQRPRLHVVELGGRPTALLSRWPFLAWAAAGGRLAPVESPLAALGPERVVAAVRALDLGGDGEPELLAAGRRRGEGFAALLARRGAGWSVVDAVGFQVGAAGLALGDLDRDGALDALVTFDDAPALLLRLPGLAAAGPLEAGPLPEPGGGDPPWLCAPLVADVDGDGAAERIEGLQDAYGARLRRLDATAGGWAVAGRSPPLGAATATFRAGDGRVVVVTEHDPARLPDGVEVRGPDGPGDAVWHLAAREGRLEVVAHRALGPGPATGVVDAWRVDLGGPALLVAATHEGAGSRRRRRALHVLALPDLDAVELGLSDEVAAATDLDGDGRSEVLLLDGRRLRVLGAGPAGRLERAGAEAPAGAARQRRVVHEVLGLGPTPEVRRVLEEVAGRLGDRPLGHEVERLRVEALLAAADADWRRARALVRQRTLGEEPLERARAARAATAEAAAVAEAAAARTADPVFARAAWTLAAEAHARQLEEGARARCLAAAAAASPRLVGAPSPRVTSWDTAVDGPLGALAEPVVADLPARVRLRDGRVQLLGDNRTAQVVGVPVRARLQDVDLQVDVALGGSAWYSAVRVGLLPLAGGPSEAPWAGFAIRMADTGDWAAQGADLATTGGHQVRLDRYRGRWRLILRHRPGLGWSELEVRDLERGGPDGAPVARLLRPVSRSPGLAGELLLGVAAVAREEPRYARNPMGLHGDRYALEVGRVVVRAPAGGAGLAALERDRSDRRALTLRAGGRLLQSDRAGARREALETLFAWPDAHRARLTLLLAAEPGEAVAVLAEGFRADPLGWYRTLEAGLRDAPRADVHRVARALHALAERAPGPCLVLLGAWTRAASGGHLAGEGLLAWLLRSRLVAGGAAATLHEAGLAPPLLATDAEALGAYGLHETHAPDVLWAPDLPGDGEPSAWVRAHRARWVGEGPARRGLVEAAAARGDAGRAAWEARRWIEERPEDWRPWGVLADLYAAPREARRRTLECLEAALDRGAPRAWIDLPERRARYAFLADDWRFRELVEPR